MRSRARRCFLYRHIFEYRCAAALVPFAGIIAACLLWPGSARSCSVCQPGDPSFSREGASAQRHGQISFFLEHQELRKTSGALPHEDGDHDESDEEDNHTRELNLYLSWAPLDRLTLSLNLPYKQITIEEKPHDAPDHRLSNSGWGDLAFSTSFVLWRNRKTLPSRWVEGRFFLKAPTGKSSERVDGELDPHLQLGTGSWDWGVGLAGVQRFQWGSVYASTFYRENREGDLDYEYGDVFLANLALARDLDRVPLQSLASWLTLGTELNLRYAEEDRFRGERYRDSGGTILYVSPFIRIGLGSRHERLRPSLRLGARFPLGQSGLNGNQHERGVYSAAFLVHF